MPVIRLTAFFKDDDGHGWSETHDKDGGGTITSLTTFIQNFNNLMQSFRRPMLGGDAFYIGCRGSYPTANGAIAGDNIELDPPMRGAQTFSGTTVNMDAAEVAVKMRWRNDASTAHSDVYIRGMWRQVIDAGVLAFDGPIGDEWKKRADLYANQLVQGAYGWVGTNPTTTSRGDVTGYQANADGTVTLNVTPKNGVNLPAADTKVAVKFARINRSKSILNRVLVCKVETGGGAVTTTELVSPSDFETEGTYIATVKSFIPYAALTYYKLARRKTGRPYGVAPGRLRVQTLH
jgi:hypothetical protein